jgi:outer membrane lipoprotein SlyB
MKKLMIAAGAASLLALSSLAAVADEAHGSITSVDPTTMTVTLDDGNTYALPADVDAASLQIGEKVKIEYSKDASGKMKATAVTPSAS